MKCDYFYTVVISTFNEEKRIEGVLLNYFRKAYIIVCDNYSTDATAEIAQKYANQIIFYKNKGFADRESYQFRFDACPTNYVLIAYAGQWTPKPLLQIYNTIAREEKYGAVAVYSMLYSYGAKIRTYGMPYVNKGRGIRFFDKRKIDLEKSRIHAEIPFAGSNSEIFFPEKKPKYCVYTFRDDDCETVELKHSRYATEDSKQRFRAGERTTLIKIFFSFYLELFKCLFWRKAVFDGMPGIINSIFRAQYFSGIQIRLWELQSGFSLGNNKILHQKIREQLERQLD